MSNKLKESSSEKVLWDTRAALESSSCLFVFIMSLIMRRNIKFSTWRSFSSFSALSYSSSIFCLLKSRCYSISALYEAAIRSSWSRFYWRWAYVRLSSWFYLRRLADAVRWFLSFPIDRLCLELEALSSSYSSQSSTLSLKFSSKSSSSSSTI